ncbi:MAG: serine hydrolase [Verrucomicrobia bacterium]|nr:serine hydrolase [Verrucomicrobiota bacterium]
MLKFLLSCFLSACWVLADAPLPGQIIADPEHPSWLMRHGGEPIFICGPGDPEGFLYRGEEKPDGTRDGDQTQILRKLEEHGGNCLYLQAVRSHGGDGTADQNPFLDHDPAKGVNPAILNQWESWFQEMDDHGILIYFLFYDDSSLVWKSGDEVTRQEESFIRTLVRRFKHHRHLIWVLAEESEEAFSQKRAEALGRIIAGEDDHGHLIGNHHHSGTTFESYSTNGPFNHYAMQLNIPLNEVFPQTRDAIAKSNGRYQVLYAENTDTPQTVEAWRHHAWTVAMSGAMPMLLGMDVSSTPVDALRQCRILSDFFEDTPFQRMHPAPSLSRPPTRLALADDDTSMIVWTLDFDSEDIPLQDLPKGSYDLLWLDPITGRRVEAVLEVNTSSTSLIKPSGIGRESVVYLQKHVSRPNDSTVYPGEHWDRTTPAESGMREDLLKQITQLAGGRGCIIRNGHLVYSWGDIQRPGDLASASKPLYSHLLFRALEEGLLESADDKVAAFRPCLNDLNPDLGYKDRDLTFRHLAFQTASFGYREHPGEAYDYNDHTMGLFWDVLVEDVFRTPWSEARARLFEPKLTGPLQFEDNFDFPENGRTRGRPKMSPRDFARFGWLYLNEGRWRNQAVISARHARMAARDPLPLGIPRTRAEEAGRCATRSIGGGGNQADHQGGYSWLWWLNTLSRDGRRWWPDAPEDMFCALGHCGQRGVAILPSQQIVMSWNDAKELHCNRDLGNHVFQLLKESVR